MHTPRRPGRPVLALAVVLTVGVGGGVAATVHENPHESYAAVGGLLEVLEPQVAAASSGGDATAGPTPPIGTLRDASRELREARRAALAPDPAPVPEEGSGLLGDDVEVPRKASGKLRAAPGREPAPGDGKVRTVRVSVERGLPVDRGVFADAVLTTLNDPRGWSAPDGVTFARTGGDDFDLEVVLASPETTDELCAPLDTAGTLSCGVVGMAVLNFKRWAHGSDAWRDIGRYRQYLVNHEVGHVLGHSHDQCAGKGKKATVMVQQTTSTKGCVPEPWPAPGRG